MLQIVIYKKLKFWEEYTPLIYSAVKQICKLNSSKSGPNPDSQDKKEYLFSKFYNKDIWTYLNIYKSCGETNLQIEFFQIGLQSGFF